jgi:hypothetical protein
VTSALTLALAPDHRQTQKPGFAGQLNRCGCIYLAVRVLRLSGS